MAGAKKGVVAVDTDGSIKWYFVSRSDAERFMKICHKHMGRALKDHSLHVRGYAMYYESEYREGDHFLDHLQLHQVERTTIIDESDSICRDLRAIFKECDGP